MAAVLVNKQTIERADGCRKEMMQAAIDLCAGRLPQQKFDRVSLDFAWAAEFCYYQPTNGVGPWLVEQLADFYPVGVEKTDDGYVVEYRHESLPEKPKARLPRSLYAKRHPVRFDVEAHDGEFDVVTMDFVGNVERHLKVSWQEKWMR